MRTSYLVVGIGAAVLLILAVRYWPAAETPSLEAEPAAVARLPKPELEPTVKAPIVADVVIEPDPEPEPAIELPALDASDIFVKEQIDDFGLPTIWTDRDDLVRRMAVVIDNAASGEYPRRQLGFLAPSGKFRIVEAGYRIFLDPASYSRYDRHLDVLESIDPSVLVALLTLIEPLLGEALGELGNRNTAAGQIERGIEQLLALPLLEGDVELVQPKVLYQYADPELEAMSNLQKQGLRMGPANVMRLQKYLSRLKAGLLANALLSQS